MCHLHIAIKDLFGIGNVERVRSILELFGFWIYVRLAPPTQYTTSFAYGKQ
jgi:hypothetical protein